MITTCKFRFQVIYIRSNIVVNIFPFLHFSKTVVISLSTYVNFSKNVTYFFPVDFQCLPAFPGEITSPSNIL